MNFSPSAIGWSSPFGPTRLGPSRSCTHAATLRSSRIKYATVPSTTACAMMAMKTHGGSDCKNSLIFRGTGVPPVSPISYNGRLARSSVARAPRPCSLLQLYKLQPSLLFPDPQHLHRRKRLAHLPANILGPIHPFAAHHAEIHITFAPRAFHR